MTSVSSSFHFDDALAKDHRGSYPSASAHPADRYPSPPMSPPQPLPVPSEPYSIDSSGYGASFYAEVDAVERDRQLARARAEQQHEAQASARARPVSYQPSTAPYNATLTPEEQLYQYEHVSREHDEWQQQQQQQAAVAAGSQSRKRASHQPPSATERAAPRERTIGEDHPAVVAFKKEHPRRAQLEFGSYILLQTLGEGEFGKVKLAIHKSFGEECAVKLIKKGNLGGDGDSRMQKVRREIEVLSVRAPLPPLSVPSCLCCSKPDLLHLRAEQHVKHPNVVRLYDLVETEKYIGIILGFADGQSPCNEGPRPTRADLIAPALRRRALRPHPRPPLPQGEGCLQAVCPAHIWRPLPPLEKHHPPRPQAREPPARQGAQCHHHRLWLCQPV